MLVRKKNGGRWTARDKIKVWYKIEPDDPDVTLQDIIEKIDEIRRKNPHLEVYFDGDLFAICSRELHESDNKKKTKKTKRKKTGRSGKKLKRGKQSKL